MGLFEKHRGINFKTSVILRSQASHYFDNIVNDDTDEDELPPAFTSV